MNVWVLLRNIQDRYKVIGVFRGIESVVDHTGIPLEYWFKLDYRTDSYVDDYGFHVGGEIWQNFSYKEYDHLEYHLKKHVVR